MEIDIPGESNGSPVVVENQFQLYPVSVSDSGEGLPYAPIDWPNPGDTWSWKVGKRINVNGYFQDRYIYPPIRFQKQGKRRGGFKSKPSVEQYVREAFPGVDVDAFFASFSWKIPAKKLFGIEGSEEELTTISVPSDEEIIEHLGPDSQLGAVGCRAGNKKCSSLVEARNSPSEAMACDVCCSEQYFCRDCCCILCCKTINSAYGGYSFIKCEAMVDDGIICGHIAHIDCALRSYMAGTVAGSIGLDAEYYCRRCDARTELISHVTKFLRTCEAIDSREDIEKILNVGICVLRGSQKTSARSLLGRIELVMAKIKSGTDLEDIWKTKDMLVITAGRLSNNENDALEVTNYHETEEFGNLNLEIESLKLEDEVNQVLRALRKAQESEYNIAEESLFAQKNYLLYLYQQLNEERSRLSTRTSTNDQDAHLDAVLNRVDQIKREIVKLREMEEVAKGFGKMSKDILNKHFGLETEN
ncbi:Protein OBERON like [Actinidia chinensis var. chinensis]|uniref:Protein OBERON like n=1 Tax=Actinidia chinensis var. chinensis TaxID=1590841 RepID=A0A2R6PRH9_ACTCC|nr:Protein OBERON like [Actinidia chinensis var. chinensis]